MVNESEEYRERERRTSNIDLLHPPPLKTERSPLSEKDSEREAREVCVCGCECVCVCL
jgi:hypothetical protein